MRSSENKMCRPAGDSCPTHERFDTDVWELKNAEISTGIRSLSKHRLNGWWPRPYILVFRRTRHFSGSLSRQSGRSRLCWLKSASSYGQVSAHVVFIGGVY
jgi:hypothetical protein